MLWVTERIITSHPSFPSQP